MADGFTPNRSYPIIDADDYIDTDWVTKLATLAGSLDTDIDALFTGKQDADSRLSAIVATGITAAMFATDIADTDGALSANSDDRFATQKAVKTYADQLIASNDAMVFKGVKDCSANPNYPAADAGWTYKVSVAGKIGGGSGKVVEVGDLLMCLVDSSASGDEAAVGANWVVSQANIDGAVIGPASATSGRVATFSGTSGKIIQDGGFALADLVQTSNVGTSGHKLPWLDGANTWSGVQTHSSNMVMSNNIPITAKETGGTTRDLLRMDTDNILRVGVSTNATVFKGSSNAFDVRPTFAGNTPYDSGNLPSTAITWTGTPTIRSAGGNFSIFWTNDTQTDQMGFAFGGSTGSTWYMLPRPAGSSDVTKNFGYNFGAGNWFFNSGLVIGSPNDGYKGPGTINAQAVYDDNTLLTDLVLDLAATGRFNKHSYRKHPIAAEVAKWWFDPELVHAFWRRERRLPGMRTWANDNERPSAGESITRLTAALETAYVLLEDAHKRLRVLEAA
jgi:hypothetical protein